MSPDTVMKYLGIILNSHQMQAGLPLDNILRIREMFESFSVKKTVLNVSYYNYYGTSTLCYNARKILRFLLVQLLDHVGLAKNHRPFLPDRRCYMYLRS